MELFYRAESVLCFVIATAQPICSVCSPNDIRGALVLRFVRSFVHLFTRIFMRHCLIPVRL